MGRRRRSYLPGGFFHLIGRTQARIHWFEDPLKDRIAEIVADAVEESDVALNAFVIMQNHFHLLARQGSAPLSAFMQPVMRRIALLLKTTLQLEDHVFGAPYWDRGCGDGAELRKCIRYIHRNPVAAGCCVDPVDYPWSSHVAYARVLENDLWRPRLTVLRGIFATGSFLSETELCTDYVSFVGDECPITNSRHTLPAGDAFARDLIRFPPQSNRMIAPRKRPDLRDVVKRGISELCPDLDVEMVRTFRGGWMSRIRAALVQRAALAGYKGCEIAGYLHMSESRVSQITRAMPASERFVRWQR